MLLADDILLRICRGGDSSKEAHMSRLGAGYASLTSISLVRAEAARD